MAPIPATSNILQATYEGNFGRRTVRCRFSDSTAAPDAAIAFRNYLIAAVAPLWSTTTQVTGWSWRAKTKIFSLPITPPGAVVGTIGASIAAVDYPRFISISGRGLEDGREARMFFFGLNFTAQPDYRFTGAESTPIAALWGSLASLISSGGFRTAGGGITTARFYANQGQSAYYQRKARQTS